MTENTLTAAEAYSQVCKLITLQVKRFKRRYGGDFYELASEANYAFLTSLSSFDPSRGTLTTFAGRVVWYGLLTRLRKKIAAQNRAKFDRGAVMEDIPDRGSRNYGDDFLASLSPRSAEVARTVFLKSCEIERRAEKSEGTRKKGRREALYDLLREMGWCATEISRAFGEIRGAM